MAADIIPFPQRRREPPSNQNPILERLVSRIRAEILKRGGVWDEEKQAPLIQRLAEILDSAMPRKR